MIETTQPRSPEGRVEVLGRPEVDPEQQVVNQQVVIDPSTSPARPRRVRAASASSISSGT